MITQSIHFSEGKFSSSLLRDQQLPLSILDLRVQEISMPTIKPTTPSAGYNISMNSLWNSVCNGLCSLVEQAEKKLSMQAEIDKFDQEIEQQIELLIPKINEMELRIQNFDAFIRERQDLATECQKSLQEEKELIATILNGVNFKSKKLNPNNPIDKRTSLLQELNCLNYAWDERIHFLRRHPTFAKNMIVHMNEQGYGHVINFLKDEEANDPIK